MKTFSMLAFFLVIVASLTFSQESPHSDKANQNRLLGAWRLVSLVEPNADGQLHEADCDGMFIFTAEGRASVQLMYRHANGSSAYAQGGYEASYGSYRIDRPSTFTFHVDGALVRTLIGKDLKRRYRISGNRLVVTSNDPNEHWKVIWERY